MIKVLPDASDCICTCVAYVKSSAALCFALSTGSINVIAFKMNSKSMSYYS